LAFLFGRISVVLFPNHPSQCHFRCHGNTDMMMATMMMMMMMMLKTVRMMNIPSC